VPGPQEQMIRVAEDDLRVEVVQQVPREHALDCGLRAHGHEHGRLHVAVRGVQNARARAGGGADGLNLEAEHSFIV
jgi:hypothetical protein